MPKTNKVAQKRWIKGVNAAAMPFAQPPGSFPRDSNLVFVRRGSLYTCDGSLLISAFQGAVQPPGANFGPLTEIFLYEPIGLPNSYYAIAKDFNTHLGNPGGLVAADGGAGGLLSAGTYKWVVTALDGAGGESTGSILSSLALAANHKGSLTWTAVPLAVGYNVYRTVVGGSTFFLVNGSTPVATNSYIDNIPDASLGTQNPPSSDNTQVSQFYQIPATSYDATNIIFTFPADFLPQKDGTPGGSGGGVGRPGAGGGGSTPTSGNQPPTPSGGVTGNISAIPLIIQFKNLMVLLLGNGIVPYTSDGTTPNTIPITNNFQASYASRTASTPQNVGDQISVNIGGTNYIFTATQAGTTSSGGAPAFSATLGSIVADGTVYWKNTGAVAAVTPPRGAAHGIVYAGSLWIGNTSPTSTTDNFDGPSCLKMSDLNNPNSWNPLNVAFLDRDDGTQITGMATFTIAESGIPPVGSLVVFKDFSTFQINGVFGASNFSIQRAQTDMGCTAPRTIQFVPGFGIVRMTHLGIAMFDGVRDRLISEEVRPYIFGGQSDIIQADWNYIWFSKAAMTAQPPMYCCAIPLQTILTGTNSSLTFTVAPFLDSFNPLGSGVYFIKVVGINFNGGTTFTTIGSEQTATCFFDDSVQVNLPANAGFDRWRVFINLNGTGGPGSENYYADFPGTSTTVFLQKPLGESFGVTPYFFGSIGTDLGQMTRLLCYDLVLKAWTVIDIPFPIAALKQFRTIGSIPITVMTGFNDGGVRRWLGGAGIDTVWDAGAVNAGAPDNLVRIRVRSPEVFGKEASDRVYFRQLAIRGTGSPASLKAQVTVNGIQDLVLAPKTVSVLPMGGGEFTGYLDIGQTGVDAHVDLFGAGPMEIQSIDWLAVAKAIRGKVMV